MTFTKKRENAIVHATTSGSSQTFPRDRHILRASRVLFFIFVLGACISTVPFVVATYEESIREGIYVVQPDNQYRAERVVPSLLQNEDLTFFACIEYDDTPVRLSVLCTDDNNFRDVDAVKWGPDNCFLGSVNLDTFPCQSAILTADYVRDGENSRLSKIIRINKITSLLQRLLDTQFADGGWSSALDTAYALFSMKPFFDVFDDRIEAGLQYLKDTREETGKCWPQEQCQVSTTASIAYLLNQAEYSDESRILRDATTYLEKSMNYIESGETYTITLIDHPTNSNNTVNTSCVYGYNTATTSLALARYPLQYNITVAPNYADIIRAVCTENIFARVTSSTRGQLLAYAGDNLSYTIPGPCWTFNNENVTCDIRTTAFATGTPISDDRKTAASEWLEEQLTSSVTGSTTPDADILDAALITVSANEGLGSDWRETLLDNILYTQLNQGSWNVSQYTYNGSYYEPDSIYRSNYSHVLSDTMTNVFMYTGYAVQSLLTNGFNRDDEEVLDAERWASNNELSVTKQLTEEESLVEEIVDAYEANVSDILADPKRNAMALYILQQNTRPFIKSDPRVILLDKQELTIDFTNPTTFALDDLSYQFSDNLRPYIWIEEKDTFAPFSFRRITMRQTQASLVEEFGYLRIMSGSDEYAKIPIIITAYPSLNLTIPREMTVFGATTILPLAITKSGHNFSCRLTWSTAGIATAQSFTIETGTTFNLPAQFTQPGTEQKDYTGSIVCSAVSSKFTFPFTINVNRFLTRPMSVGPASLFINGSDSAPGTAEFTIRNLLDESIDVIVSLRDPNATAIEFSEYFLSLYPSETRTVTVSVLPIIGENLTLVNSVVIRSFNVEERIPLVVELIVEPVSVTPVWMIISGSVFAIGLLAIVGYFGYSNRVKLRGWWSKRVQKESYYDQVRRDVQAYELKEQAIAIKNLTTIFKMQGLPEMEIRKRLREQGFSDEEVMQALKMKTDAATPAVPAGQAKNSVPPTQPPRM